MGKLILRDGGLTDTLSTEEKEAKLRQFVEDAYAMEKEVAHVSLAVITFERFETIQCNIT